MKTQVTTVKYRKRAKRVESTMRQSKATKTANFPRLKSGESLQKTAAALTGGGTYTA